MSVVEDDRLRYLHQQIHKSASPRRQRRDEEILLTNSPLTETFLPPFTYAHDRAKPSDPLSLTTELQHPASSTRLQAFAPDAYGDGVSPVDPHDFYRPFQDPFTTDVIASSDRPPFTGGPLDAMRIPPARKLAPTSSRENVASSRHPRTSGERKNSGPASTSPSIKSNPSTPSGPTRPANGSSGSSGLRHSQLQHLVDRFNQKSDDTLPLPGRRPGVVAARAGSPALKSSKAAGMRTVVRNDTGKRDFERNGVAKDRQQVQSKLVRNGTPNGDGHIRSPKNIRSERSKVSEANNPWASQSMTNLHHFPTESTRRPLFGEVLDVSVDQAGFGIEPTPRRGSEGSSRPLVAHRRAKSHIESPCSPTAWYLGPDQSQVASETGKNESPVIRPPHRRAKSDFARNQPISEDVPCEPLELNRPRDVPKPHSRIPLRRAAPSGANTSQTLADGSADKGSTTRGHGSASRSTGKPADTVVARSRTPLSPRTSHSNVSIPSMKAYISAPIPTRSPPLRSSRPRLPVPAASTSASRAKIVARHGGTQQDHDVTNLRRGGSDVTSRPKNIPELGAVDFAARRERIQRALTQSVKESETQSVKRVEKELHAQSAREGEGDQNLTQSETVETVLTEGGHQMDEESEPPQAVTDVESKTQIDEGGSCPEQETASTKGDADSDRADQESIRIMLESSPITQVNLEDGSGYQWDDLVRETEISRKSGPDAIADSTHSPMSEVQTVEQLIEAGASDIDDSPAFAQEENQDVRSADGDTTWSSCTLPTPQTGNSTQDNSTYNAINRILEQYHQTDLSSPSTLREIRQRLLTETPELARLGGWDAMEVPRLVLQGLNREAPDSPSGTPELPQFDSKTEKEPQELEQELVEADHEVTDIDSDGFGVVQGEDRYSYRLSEGAWSSPRPSMEVDEETRLMHRASLRSKSDWEDASPSVADWMQPQAEGPTPPPKEPVSPVEFRESADSVTPRLSLDGPSQASEVRSTGKRLGLAINVDESANAAFLPPPPPPSHAPPPPPVLATRNEDATPASDRSRRPRSPPSPSIYSRNPPSTIFPTTVAGGFRIRSSSFRASDLSTPLQPVFTPSGPQTRSTSSSQSRDANNLEHPFGQVVDMSSAPPVPGPEQARLTPRRNVIKELLDTESTYFHDMRITIDLYKLSAKNSMTTEDIRVLFGNLDQLVAFIQPFFDSLRQASSSVYVVPRHPSNRRTSASTAASSATDDRLSMTGTDMTDDDRDRRTFIGEVFGQYLARMEKVYGDYMKNHDAANKKLEELQHRPAVTNWLAQCNAAAHDLTNAWSLDSLLVKPVQRLLKYPLLLTELLKYTPENHPDYTPLEIALREIKAVSLRINNMKKRAELVEKVLVLKRKRKESDVRAGLSKALGRRTEKLKQHVGLSETVEEHGYKEIEGRLHIQITHLLLAMKDVEGYLTGIHKFMDEFQSLIQSIESYIDVSPSGHLELESKWRKFGIATRELSAVALGEHKAAVEACVLEPMRTLIDMYQRPLRMVQEREKRKADYARCKAVKAGADKLDTRMQEEIETFEALNATLKDELPKLYAGTDRLVVTCLSNFVDLQMLWQATWQMKLRSILDERQITESLPEIVNQCLGDFDITEAHALSLGICNGSFLAETINLLSPQSSRLGDDYSFRQPSIASSRSRAISLNSNSPPQASSPSDSAFMPLGSGGYLVSPTSESPLSRPRHHVRQGNQPSRVDRTRAGSYLSNSGYTGEAMMPTASIATRSFSTMTASSSVSHPNGIESHRPSTSTTRSVEITNPLPLPTRPGGAVDSPAQTRPASGSAYLTDPNLQTTPPTSRPFSGFFSSAMPMSDNNTPRTASPRTSRPTSPFSGRDRPHALFAVASRDEFNVDRSRSEAGYPFLTYVEGEIFDVVAEKGELWLARNQDDQSHQIGWIWCKHFVKLVDED